jgi:hypothetical protein
VLELGGSEPIIANYISDLKRLKEQDVSHELGLKGPFQTLLDKAAKRRRWTLAARDRSQSFSDGETTTRYPNCAERHEIVGAG